MSPSRIIQRSPDLGLGIRLQRLLPEVKPPTTAVVIPVEDVTEAIIAVETAWGGYRSTLVHRVALSKSFDTDKTYTFKLVGVTAVPDVDYVSTLTDADFSNEVTYSSGTITVPAGVVTFAITITTGDSFGGPVVYEIWIGMHGALGIPGVSLGIGTISDI